MASPELRRLHDLYEVDLAILEIRKRAAALDTGADLQAKLKALEANLASGEGAEAKKLLVEIKDLELANATLTDKIKRIDKELYSGKVVNSREVEGYNMELASLRKQLGTNEDRYLSLLDGAETARKLVARIDAKIAELKGLILERQKSAQIEKARLETEFQRRQAQRPGMLKDISPMLLAKYEQLRKNYETGMADVIKFSSCGGCGTLLPTRILQNLKDDRVVACEECHRILYYTEGLI
jgi:predicted  nucleic acid-binding Zn-ribbon protein